MLSTVKQSMSPVKPNMSTEVCTTQLLHTRLGHTIRTQLHGGKSFSVTVLLGKESYGAINERLGFSQPALLQQQAACLHQHLEL